MTETAAAIIWFIGIVVWTIIRWPHRRKARKTATTVDKKSTAERASLAFCIIGLVIIPALHLATGFLNFANYTFQPFMGYLGLLAMIGFLVTFYLSHKHLARNWSVTLEIREDHKLVQHGIYKYVRHPMYSSFWLWGLAQFLLIPNWIAGLTGIVSVACLYFGRIANEEAMMRDQFGEEYEEYSRRTSRLVPGIY